LINEFTAEYSVDFQWTVELTCDKPHANHGDVSSSCASKVLILKHRRKRERYIYIYIYIYI